MTLKTLLKYVYKGSNIELWDSNNGHCDLARFKAYEQIPNKYLNCKVEEDFVLSSIRDNTIVISIFTK